MAQTLTKNERLSGKTSISRLIDEGRWASIPNFRFCCLYPNEEDYCRIIVSVPKKFFKHAVKRNLLKRRIREAYRTQKELLQSNGISCDLLIQYNAKEILSYEEIRESVASILNAIAKPE